MWHWLFATLSLPGKPSSSPKSPSNEKQTWLGISCGVTAFSDFVLNPGACFETSRGHWKMKCKRCGNLVFLPLIALDRGQLNWGRREVGVPGWRSTSHLAKLTVSHPSIPTVLMGETPPGAMWDPSSLKITFFSSHCIPAIGVEIGQTCLDNVGHHLTSNKPCLTLSEVCSGIFWWVIWCMSGTRLASEARNLTLLSITFSRIWMEGKLSRWP